MGSPEPYNAAMLASSRKRFLLYLGIAILLNLRYVISTFIMPTTIPYALGRVGGTLLLVAIIGEIIAWLVHRQKQRP